MADAVVERGAKPVTASAIDEISVFIKQISENARLARQSEKELANLRKQNEKSFAEMHKALDRLRTWR